MHILLIHQAFATLDEPGGTRHYEIACHLVARGHRVTVIASPISYLTGRRSEAEMPREVQKPAELTILRTYTYPAWHRSFLHRVISFLSFMASSFLTGLRVDKVDLVWGTSPPIFQGGTAWLLARLKGAAFLFEVRDLWPAFAVGVGVLRNRLLIRLAEWFERFLYRRADMVVVNSPGFIEHVRLHGARRVHLVPNGSDPTMFNPQANGSAFRREYGLGDKFVALYAGAHGMSNDLRVVLAAAAALRDRPDIVIVLVGDGKEKEALMTTAAEMGLTNLQFIKPLPKNQMAQALAAADACIAILKPIELYKTVYPNKVFDYMAAGRAVILAIDGVIREVIETAEAGVFTPPGNAAALATTLCALADDPQHRKRMGENGRRYIEAHFDRAKLAAEMEEVIKATIDH